MAFDTQPGIAAASPLFDPTAAIERKRDAARAADAATFAQIREKGFAAYAEDMRQKKIEEMRERILTRMGLSEEQLSEMPAEQQGAIENMIAEEIRRRMTAQAEVEAGDDAPAGGSPSGLSLLSPNGGGAGLALLKAIEDAQTASDKAAHKDDEGR